jgi:hypothetical protein
LAALLLGGSPTAAHAQFFLASRPQPEFTIGSLVVSASLTPALGPVRVEVLWGLVIPPARSAAELEQDLYLLWPGAVRGDASLGPADPALARHLEERGFTVIDAGRLPLFARSLYQLEGRAPRESVAGSAPFVTFVRGAGGLGLTSPASYVRILWTPRLADRTWLMNLAFSVPGLLRPKKASWVEEAFWGPRHLLSIGFNDAQHPALLPLYLEHRDRVVRLSEDPAQVLVNFADADHLKIDDVSPPAARRRLSETLDSTEVVSLFLDRSAGLSPQALTIHFGYFSGLQAWAPILIPVLFFVLGNAARPLIERLSRRIGRALTARIHLGRPDRPGRQRGTILPLDTLARITPRESTYADLVGLCGPPSEERQQLGSADRRTLLYRGRRLVPQWSRRFWWVATVSGWEVEAQEVEIEIEEGRVRDVQARVQRSRLAHPELD